MQMKEKCVGMNLKQCYIINYDLEASNFPIPIANGSSWV